MTESDWVNCHRLDRLLDWLPFRLDERRWRLLACGICRQFERFAGDADLHALLGVAESFADGQRTARQLAAANRKAARPAGDLVRAALGTTAAWETATDPAVRQELAGRVLRDGTRAAAGYLIGIAAQPLIRPFFDPPQGQGPEVALLARFAKVLLEDHAAVVHDLVGNPFRRGPITPDVLAWRNGFVAHLARDLYDGDRWDEVPVLGDALEDAGCTDRTVLEHCHGKGPHVRGCWVVDRLLGRVPAARPVHAETLVRHYPERYCTPLEPVIARGGSASWKLHLLLESGTLAEAVGFVSEVEPGDLPSPAVLPEVVAALRSRLNDLTPRGRYLAGVRLTLLGVSPPDATRPEYVLGEAAHDALNRAVQEAVMVPLEATARGLPK